MCHLLVLLAVFYLFHRYGEIVNINLVRNKKTGKGKGFCFIGYEDQRSTILAVDNLNGIKVSSYGALHAAFDCNVALRNLPLFTEQCLSCSACTFLGGLLLWLHKCRMCTVYFKSILSRF